MAEIVVWGVLPKAQDDPTTIDSAIAAAIAAHNADPTAHLDTGASLDLHRTNDTLDHPAASVLSDKTTGSELLYAPDFETLTQWTAHGETAISDFMGVEIKAVPLDSEPLGYLHRTLQLYIPFVSAAPDLLFQASIIFQGDVLHTDTVFGLGLNYSGSTLVHSDGFGFSAHNGDLKAFYSIGSTVTTTDIPNVDLTTMHTFRVQRLTSLGEISWFVDGVNVLTQTPTVSAWSNDAEILFSASASGAYELDMQLLSLLVSRSMQ